MNNSKYEHVIHKSQKAKQFTRVLKTRIKKSKGNRTTYRNP